MNNISDILLCPVCKKPLAFSDNSLKCANGHSFDRAKSGYVNLLRSNAASHGDDKEMVRARTAFLDGGYYNPMRDKLCECVESVLPNGGVLLDAGCGEGWYDEGIHRAVKRNFSLIGVDISKEAVNHAVKRVKSFGGGDFYAVASVYELPVADSSVDMVISVFSPFAKSEFDRVLKSSGYLINVIPLENHLMPLKAVIYDNPYKNEVADFTLDGYTLDKSIPVCYDFHLSDNASIMALFSMTPYFYRTDKVGHERLAGLDSLDCRAEFRVLLYKKRV